MSRSEKAKEYFLNGYNCSQAVAMAFADLIGLDEKQVAKMVSGFGGGFGRMREVCGSVSGMVFIASSLYGYDDATDNIAKRDLYAEIQCLCNKFIDENGSMICKKLLGLTESEPKNPTPEARTKEYYKKRPCAELVECSAKILEQYINEKDKK